MRLAQITTLLALAAALPLQAQQSSPPVSGERVVFVTAVVGDSAITNVALCDLIVARLVQERKQPQCQSADGERIRPEVLQDKITELVLFQTAAKDTTIRVEDSRLRQGVEAEISRRQREVGGPAQFEQLLRQNGNTLAEFREYLTVELRKTEMIKQYLQRARGGRKPPPLSEQEIRDYFAANGQALIAQWGPKPALVTIDHILLQITPSDTADAAARARADSAFQRLRAGEDFEALAKRVTEEPGGRERGGDLGWIKESEVVREFARFAFSTPAGAYTIPFRTSFGWHVLKVERVRGAEAHVRHILFQPTITEADVQRAEQRGDSIAALLRAGADPGPIARQLSDPEFNTRFGPNTAEAYQQEFGVEIGNAEEGAIIGPVTVGEGPRRRVAVLRVAKRTPAGNWSLSDPMAYEAVRNAAQDEKLMDELVGELRRSVYVKILEP